MYVHSNFIGTDIEQSMIDPNIVSGADFDNRGYSNYSGSDAELLSIHNRIVKAKSEVVEGKKKLAIANKAMMDLAPFLSSASKEWGRLIALKQRGVITDPTELEKLDVQIQKARAEKDKYRFEYSKLTSELSKLDTYINSREQGSIYGLTQEFEAKSGMSYAEALKDAPEEEIINDEVETPDGEIMEVDVEAPNLKQNIVSKVMAKTGLSKNQTYMLLGGIGVLAVIVIAKR